ncbi:S-adenosyl-L-methionine-dependent methyltransferase [Pyrenochaeta sp. MPI-SDFR-AT-0127]|nr:S-adenosyl-L-methionine-dependent methyltransferase [Pyrenochaeta sp. MPI-SDFR-AT-0127]
MASSGPYATARVISPADKYDNKMVPSVATPTNKIVEWLNPQSEDEILDIGCGDGILTAKIAPYVKRIVGVDISSKTIESFKKAFPFIDSRVIDCRYLGPDSSLCCASFDKIFSNAALPWILRDSTTRANTLKGLFEALKPGGIFVSESGGLGNVAEAYTAIVSAVVHRGVSAVTAHEASPWWFPSMESMQSLVEGAGFNWIKGEIELRQTVLANSDEEGIKRWVRLFGASFLDLLATDELRDAAVAEVAEVLECVGRRQHDGAFIINYIRLRFVAQKPHPQH